jgi:hypothetical protein
MVKKEWQRIHPIITSEFQDQSPTVSLLFCKQNNLWGPPQKGWGESRISDTLLKPITAEIQLGSIENDLNAQTLARSRV